MNCYCRCRLYCPYATKEEKGKVENVTTRTVPSSDNKPVKSRLQEAPESSYNGCWPNLWQSRQWHRLNKYSSELTHSIPT